LNELINRKNLRNLGTARALLNSKEILGGEDDSNVGPRIRYIETWFRWPKLLIDLNNIDKSSLAFSNKINQYNSSNKPIHIFHGLDDERVSVEGSRRYARQFPDLICFQELAGPGANHFLLEPLGIREFKAESGTQAAKVSPTTCLASRCQFEIFEWLKFFSFGLFSYKNAITDADWLIGLNSNGPPMSNDSENARGPRCEPLLTRSARNTRI